MSKDMTYSTSPLRTGTLLGLFILASCFFYSPMISKLAIVLGDGWNEYASSFFLRRWTKQGVFPFWNSDVGFGIPDWISYSPFPIHNLIATVLPLDLTWNLMKLINFIFSGWFMSLYLSRHFDRLPPAFLGGLIVSLAQLNVDMVFASYFLFMGALLLADRMTRVKTYASALGFAAVFLFYVASSLPQPGMCAGVFLFVLIATRLQLFKKLDFQNWFLALFPFGVAFLFFAPQGMRIKELLDLSNRSQVADQEVYSILPWEYLRLAWAHYNAISQDFSLNFIPMRIIAVIQSLYIPGVRVGFGSLPYYGATAFFASVALCFKRNLLPFEKKLLAAALFVLAAPLLNPFLYPLLKHIPILGIASGSSLFGGLFSTVLLPVVAILAASGFNSMAAEEPQAEFRFSKLRKFFFIMFLLVGLAAFARLGLHATLAFKEKEILDLLGRWISRFFFSEAFQQPAEFYATKIPMILKFVKAWTSTENVYFWAPVLLIMTTIAIFYFRFLKQSKTAVFFVACFVLLIVDASFFRPVSFFAHDELFPYREEAALLKQDNSIFRVLAIQGAVTLGTEPAGRDLRRIILRPESNLLYGLASPECYRSVVIKSYAEFMARMTGAGDRGRIVGEFRNIKDPLLLDLANIKYLITPLSMSDAKFPSDRYELIGQTAQCNVYRNKYAKERAFFLKPASSVDGVFIREYLPHMIKIEVRATTPNDLILADQHYPGWIARIDGVEVAIDSYQGIFRRVAIPPGRHLLEFEYRPFWLKDARWLFVIGILVCLAGSFFLSRKK